MKKALILFLFYFSSANLYAQVSVKDSSISCSIMGASYSFQLPGADLSQRFGYCSDVKLSYFHKNKNNWIWGVDLSQFFGNKIKENGILDSIKTSDGHVINSNGTYAEVRLFERGHTASIKFGKLFNVWAPNPNSGIICMAGIGFMQHKIRIDDIGNFSPQLTTEMKKGYDRLTSGISITEFIGYMYLGNKRMLNFFGGFEFTQGFLKGKREWLYDLQKPGTDSRIDLLSGFRIGWILPLYKKSPNEFYYN